MFFVCGSTQKCSRGKMSSLNHPVKGFAVSVEVTLGQLLSSYFKKKIKSKRKRWRCCLVRWWKTRASLRVQAFKNQKLSHISHILLELFSSKSINHIYSINAFNNYFYCSPQKKSPRIFSTVHCAVGKIRHSHVLFLHSLLISNTLKHNSSQIIQINHQPSFRAFRLLKKNLYTPLLLIIWMMI